MGSNADDNIAELKKVYASANSKESAEIYDKWSGDYEEHMRDVGYTHPTMVAAMLARHHSPKEAKVLDAGSGTGIMANILTSLGYTSLYGFDASQGMLDIAQSKNLYQALQLGFLGEQLDYPDNDFSAAVAAGVFTEGHAPLAGLDELVRVVNSGGHIVFSIARTYLGDVFEAKAQQLESDSKWRRVDTSSQYDSAPLADSVLLAQVFVFEVL